MSKKGKIVRGLIEIAMFHDPLEEFGYSDMVRVDIVELAESLSVLWDEEPELIEAGLSKVEQEAKTQISIGLGAIAALVEDLLTYTEHSIDEVLAMIKDICNCRHTEDLAFAQYLKRGNGDEPTL